MMIKKQLGVLAGAVVLASGAHAAVEVGNFDGLATTPGGTDSSVMLALIDNDAVLGVDVSTYWIEVGVTSVDQLQSGTSFSFVLSENAAAFLSVADEYALFGNSNQNGTYDSVTSFDYFGDDVGTVYAAEGPRGAKGTFGALRNDMLVLQGLLGDIAASVDGNGGEFGVIDGDAGDLAGSVAFTDILNPLGAVTQLFYSQGNPGGRNLLDPLESPIATSVSIDGVTDIVFTTIPVPAAAWLFGSALLGLGVVRRKK